MFRMLKFLLHHNIKKYGLHYWTLTRIMNQEKFPTVVSKLKLGKK